MSDHRFDGLQIGTPLLVRFRDHATLSDCVTRADLTAIVADSFLVDVVGKLFQVTPDLLKLTIWEPVTCWREVCPDEGIYAVIVRAAIVDVVVLEPRAEVTMEPATELKGTK